MEAVGRDRGPLGRETWSDTEQAAADHVARPLIVSVMIGHSVIFTFVFVFIFRRLVEDTAKAVDLV